MTDKVTKSEKKQPMRKCLGCMESFKKRELIRVVRTPDGNVQLDFKGKVSGRGAYICGKTECLKKAVKAKRLERNLDCEIPEEIYSRLEKEISDHG